MKRIYVLLIVMLGAFQISNAQLVHTKGKMGVGFRGGIGTKNEYNIGLFYHYYTSSQLGVFLEVDREKAKFDHSNFTNQFLVGVGCEYAFWKPCKWLYMNLSLAGNIGYDEWICTIMDWQEKHLFGGLNGGFGLEAYPWHFLSFVLKARQFVLFGKGENYFKPDFSLGVKFNW